MPIYEYQCAACGHKMEAIQKMSEAPLKACPACKKSKLEKLVSASGFQLKGGGWYMTDYSSKGKEKNKAKKEGTEGEKKKSSTEAKTDTTSSSGKTESK